MSVLPCNSVSFLVSKRAFLYLSTMVILLAWSILNTIHWIQISNSQTTISQRAKNACVWAKISQNAAAITLPMCAKKPKQEPSHNSGVFLIGRLPMLFPRISNATSTSRQTWRVPGPAHSITIILLQVNLGNPSKNGSLPKRILGWNHSKISIFITCLRILPLPMTIRASIMKDRSETSLIQTTTSIQFTSNVSIGTATIKLDMMLPKHSKLLLQLPIVLFLKKEIMA